MRSKSKKGFSLIELMVVIVIIAMVATLVIASLISARKKGRDARRIADMNSLKTALELFFEHNKVYPATATWDTQLSGNNCGLQPCMRAIPIPQPGAGQSTYEYCGSAVASTYTLRAVLEDETAKPPSSASPSAGCATSCGGAKDYCLLP